MVNGPSKLSSQRIEAENMRREGWQSSLHEAKSHDDGDAETSEKARNSKIKNTPRPSLTREDHCHPRGARHSNIPNRAGEERSYRGHIDGSLGRV